jgi:hypothetical protein
VWSSERVFAFLALGSALAFATVHCSPGPTHCLRYSDCDPGLTCAYGRCVYPPVVLGDGSVLEASTVADAGVSVVEAGANDAADESTDDTSIDDASADDASTE